MSILEPPAKLAVRNVEDLVGVVPYLIGFHPSASLVVLVIGEGRVQVTARVDLDAVRHLSGVAALTDRLWQRFPTAQCWFLAYAERSDVAWEVLENCGHIAGDARLGRLVAVVGERWRCDHRRGSTGPLRCSAVAAEATVCGLQARASRHELAIHIAGPSDAETDALIARFEAAAYDIGRRDAPQRQELLTQLMPQARDVDDYVRLAVLMSDADAQLSVLAGLSSQNAAAAVTLWSSVVRHCLADYLVGPLGALGLASWLSGEGALQTICLERLEQLDPLAPVAALLDWLNSQVLPPSDWPRFRDALVASMAHSFELLDGAPSPPR